MSEDVTDQSAQRRAKLAALRERSQAYPNDFRPDARAADLHERFAGTDAGALEREPVPVAIAGRMMTRRIMGKASFAHLRDVSGDIQIYLRRDDLPEGRYAEFRRFDIGDIVAVEGEVFRTRTGELSVKARSVRLLVKSLLPLPEKHHGLSDVETRYRRRYVDLIVNERSREVFRARSRTVDHIRRFFIDRGFLEVETPMMHPIPGGGGGPTLRDPPQRARHRPLPAGCAGAVPEASRGRRARARVRDQPQLPQRGRLHPAQPRVHDAGVLPGVRGLRGDDGPHRGAGARRGARGVRLGGDRVPGRGRRPRSAVPPAVDGGGDPGGQCGPRRRRSRP